MGCRTARDGQRLRSLTGDCQLAAATSASPPSTFRAWPLRATAMRRCSTKSSKDMMELVASASWTTVSPSRATKRVYNFPFLMGQGVWLDSEKLGPSDEVGEVLKHGTLSIGFIGLAETLISLYGHHHGESDAMQEKGLAIVQYMRRYLDARSERTAYELQLAGHPGGGSFRPFCTHGQKALRA